MRLKLLCKRIQSVADNQIGVHRLHINHLCSEMKKM